MFERWNVGTSGCCTLDASLLRRWMFDVVGTLLHVVARCCTLLDVVGRCWTLLDRRWTLDMGHRTSNVQTLDVGRWALDVEFGR